MKAVFLGTILASIFQCYHCNNDSVNASEFNNRKDCFCSTTVEKLNPEFHPIFISPINGRVIHPNKPYLSFYFEANEEIEFHCPDAHVKIKDRFLSSFEMGKCVWGDMIEIDGTLVPLPDILCTEPVESAVRKTEEPCHPYGMYVKVGFELQDGRFITQYVVCYDYIRKIALSTYHRLQRWAPYSSFQLLPKFQDGDFYPRRIHTDNLYNMLNQRAMINKQLGRGENDAKYINNFMNLKRLTLVPRSNFIYKYEKASTRWSINVVPQWSTVAQYNWHKIEKLARRYASVVRTDLEIYTGVLCTIKFFSEIYQRPKKIYLHHNGTWGMMPIPFLIWKVIYDPINLRGVTIISLNNPFYKYINTSMVCPDISSEYGHMWPFDRNRNNYYPFGYVYACRIDDFRRIAQIIPEFEVHSLLKLYT